MEKRKAKNAAIVSIGLGIILSLLPFLGVLPGLQQGLIFGGLLFIAFGVLIGQLGSE